MDSRRSQSAPNYTAFLSGYVPTRNDILRTMCFSEKHNVIVLLFDSIDSEVTKKIFAEQAGLRRTFRGFINFEDMVACNATSLLNLAALWTGRAYTGATPLNEHIQAIYSDASFIAAFAACKADIVVNLFGDNKRLYSSFLHENYQSFSSRRDGLLLRLFFHRAREGHAARLQGQQANKESEEVYAALASRPVCGRNTALHFHWFYGAHAPYVFDGMGRAIPPRSDIAGYKDRVLYEFRRIGVLLDSWRKNGLLDKSAIILMADHSTGHLQDPSNRQVEGNGGDAFPFLMIKPRGPERDFSASSVPVSNLKLASLIKMFRQEDFRPAQKELEDILEEPLRRHYVVTEEGYVEYRISPGAASVEKTPVSRARAARDLSPLIPGQAYDLRACLSRAYPDIYFSATTKATRFTDKGILFNLPCEGEIVFRAPLPHEPYSFAFKFFIPQALPEQTVHFSAPGSPPLCIRLSASDTHTATIYGVMTDSEGVGMCRFSAPDGEGPLIITALMLEWHGLRAEGF